MALITFEMSGQHEALLTTLERRRAQPSPRYESNVEKIVRTTLRMVTDDVLDKETGNNRPPTIQEVVEHLKATEPTMNLFDEEWTKAVTTVVTALDKDDLVTALAGTWPMG